MGRVILHNVLPLVLLALIVYVFRGPLFVVSRQVMRDVAPCRVPISYEIVSIDPRFKLATSSVEDAAKTATDVWELSAHKDLFREKAGGVVQVSLVYDERQHTTATLQRLGDTIESGTETY